MVNNSVYTGLNYELIMSMNNSKTAQHRAHTLCQMTTVLDHPKHAESLGCSNIIHNNVRFIDQSVQFIGFIAC
jgi:hypothetical protein